MECTHTHFMTWYREWDAWWCRRCGEWTEDPCPDPECEYCPSRPDYPPPDSAYPPGWDPPRN